MGSTLSEEAIRDLRGSGLRDEHIEAMRCRPATVQDLPFAATGYVIPYFIPTEEGEYVRLEVSGTPFSRIKILSHQSSGNGIPKYYQRAATGSHVYFPPLVEAARWWDTNEPLIITEGEKKAACATAQGFLTCAVGGIDSWRSKKLMVPPEAVVAGGTKAVLVELDDEAEQKIELRAADELTWLPLEGRRVYVCFDSDGLQSKRNRVARAAFDFAIWLETQGADPRQVVLPAEPGEKVGLDDFLVSGGKLEPLLSSARFPTRPGLKMWARKQLANPRRTRNTMTSVARGILAALDERGTRFRDPYGMYYYFDKATDKLHLMPIETGQSLQVAAPSFHQLLVREYGVSSADRELVQRLVDDFESLEPVQQVTRVHRQSYAAPDALYYQLSDSRMAKVTASGIEVLRNGTDRVLFQVGAEEVELYNKQLPPGFGWLSMLKTTSLEPIGTLTLDETHLLVACLFYLSPWLRRWRGLMLPAELAVSEAGSGKSSLYQLRSGIFTGSARLQHQPEDMRSWYSSIADARGLWVADNMGSKIDVRISNEIARLITDPDPAFELRELYTTSKVHRMPVDCVFAFTAIYNPFHRPDILQRSLQLRFHAITKRDGGWMYRQIADQGRSMWVTHHLQTISRFLDNAKDMEWGVSSKHRLVGFEQSLRCMGITLGRRADIERVIQKLPEAVQESITADEPVIAALRAFVKVKQGQRNRRTNKISLDEIVEWAQYATGERYQDLRVLRNPRLLEKYIQAHAHDVYNTTGIRATPEEFRGYRLFEIDFSKVAAV